MLARLVAAAVLSLAACSSSSGPSTSLCGTGSKATLTVTVVDTTNEPINVCDAKVVATGPETVTLTPGGGSSRTSCDYLGTVSPGAYTISATATGYQPASIHESVSAGCNVPGSIDVTPIP